MQKTANCSRLFHADPGPQARGSIRLPAQMLRLMRVTTIVMLIFCLHVSAKSSSQTISLSGKNLPIREVFTAIERQTGYLVWGRADFLDNFRPVTVSANKMPLHIFLSVIMKDQPYSYKLVGNTIILSEKPAVEIAPIQDNRVITAEPTISIGGFINNAETNEPIAGASVTFKKNRGGVTTDNAGRFVLAGAPTDATIIVSSVGFTSLEMAILRLVGMEFNT